MDNEMNAKNRLMMMVLVQTSFTHISLKEMKKKNE